MRKLPQARGSCHRQPRRKRAHARLRRRRCCKLVAGAERQRRQLRLGRAPRASAESVEGSAQAAGGGALARAGAGALERLARKKLTRQRGLEAERLAPRARRGARGLQAAARQPARGAAALERLAREKLTHQRGLEAEGLCAQRKPGGGARLRCRRAARERGGKGAAGSPRGRREGSGATCERDSGNEPERCAGSAKAGGEARVGEALAGLGLAKKARSLQRCRSKRASPAAFPRAFKPSASSASAFTARRASRALSLPSASRGWLAGAAPLAALSAALVAPRPERRGSSRRPSDCWPCSQPSAPAKPLGCCDSALVPFLARGAPAATAALFSRCLSLASSRLCSRLAFFPAN